MQSMQAAIKCMLVLGVGLQLVLVQLVLGVGLLRQDCFLVATGVSFNAGQMHGDKLSPEHAD